jgi:hypothetical protein
MKVTELRAELKALGLNTKGKKADLETRLQTALEADADDARAPSPPPPLEAMQVRLDVLTGPYAGKRFDVVVSEKEISSNQVRLGRGATELLKSKGGSMPKDSELSTNHARISLDSAGSGALVFVDLSSSNDSVVDGAEAEEGEEVALRDGSVLRVGQAEIRVSTRVFSLAGADAGAPAPLLAPCLPGDGTIALVALDLKHAQELLKEAKRKQEAVDAEVARMAAQMQRMELEHAAAQAAMAAQVIAAVAQAEAAAAEQERERAVEQAAAAAAAAERQRQAAAGGAWTVTGGEGATVSDGQNIFFHNGSRSRLDHRGYNKWIAAATNPLDGAAGRASWTTTGFRIVQVGLALAEKDVSHGGDMFDDAGGSWGIHCYDGRIRAQGEHQTYTGRIAAGVTVSVEWDQGGLRFFVNGKPRGAKIVWGGAAPSQVRLVACLRDAGTAVTITS